MVQGGWSERAVKSEVVIPTSLVRGLNIYSVKHNA